MRISVSSGRIFSAEGMVAAAEKARAAKREVKLRIHKEGKFFPPGRMPGFTAGQTPAATGSRNVILM
jgi:hypothetical protein